MSLSSCSQFTGSLQELSLSLSSACGLRGVGLRNLAWASPCVLSSRPASGLDDMTWRCVRELLTCTSGQPAAAKNVSLGRGSIWHRDSQMPLEEPLVFVTNL